MITFLCITCVFIGFSFCMKIDSSSVTVRDLDSTHNNSEIRCYCNLPACITTSYMCKSEGLGCFSDILAHSDVTKARHGCLDLLEPDRQDQCQNEPSHHSISQPRSLLLCCYQDLCNHVDSPETRQRFNDSVLASSLVTDVDREVMMVNSRLRQTPGYSNAEVWFRAATIAVPICGALILFILIALAVRILQSDAMDDRVLAAKLRAKHSGFSPVSLNAPSFVHQLHDHDRNDNFTKKMPLLFQNESSNSSVSSIPFSSCVNRPSNHGQGVNVLHSCQQRHKNEANAKLNLSQNGAETTVPPTSIPVVPVHTPPLQTGAPSNLIDLEKSSSPCNNNCNIYQQEDSPEELDADCSLLSSLPSSNHKLTYKKPLVITWTDSDVRASHPQ